MKRKPPPSPGQLSLTDYQATVTQLIQETDCDPDYERLKRIFAELAKEYRQ